MKVTVYTLTSIGYLVNIHPIVTMDCDLEKGKDGFQKDLSILQKENLSLFVFV